MRGNPCKGCGEPIREWCWRDPGRCLSCYLSLKRGVVLVCTALDVRVLDTMPGGFAMQRDAQKDFTR